MCDAWFELLKQAADALDQRKAARRERPPSRHSRNEGETRQTKYRALPSRDKTRRVSVGILTQINIRSIGVFPIPIIPQ